jgi:hypothetical protein
MKQKSGVARDPSPFDALSQLAAAVDVDIGPARPREEVVIMLLES